MSIGAQNAKEARIEVLQNEDGSWRFEIVTKRRTVEAVSRPYPLRKDCVKKARKFFPYYTIIVFEPNDKFTPRRKYWSPLELSDKPRHPSGAPVVEYISQKTPRPKNAYMDLKKQGEPDED